MKVRDVMQTRIITAYQDSTYEEVARLLQLYNISGLPIISRTGELVGILSEKDLVGALFPKPEDFYKNPEAHLNLEDKEAEIARVRFKPIFEFMSPEVTAVFPNDPILKAGSIMIAKNVHRLPVVEKKKLVGIISRRDIFKNILDVYLDGK